VDVGSAEVDVDSVEVDVDSDVDVGVIEEDVDKLEELEGLFCIRRILTGNLHHLCSRRRC
jgi:hypothetical protein